jgi:hypothetical protein
VFQLLGVLLQCSTFHCRYEGLLHDCNAMRASYLFQQDKHYDVSYDTGDKARLLTHFPIYFSSMGLHTHGRDYKYSIIGLHT